MKKVKIGLPNFKIRRVVKTLIPQVTEKKLCFFGGKLLSAKYHYKLSACVKFLSQNISIHL